MKHNYYKFIKNLTLALALVSGLISVQAQDINFTFANAQNTNDGMDDFYEVDILISSNADFKLGSGLVYFTYNTAAFGTNVSSNSNIEFSQPAGSILSQTSPNFIPYYASFVQNDNTTSRVAFSFQQALSGLLFTSDNVTSTPTVLFHMKIKYADINEDPMIAYETGAVFLDQFFTACGSAGVNPIFETPDCLNHPNTQLFNDTFDSSGAVIDVTPPVITLTGANPQTIELGAGYSELGATTDDGSSVVIDASAFVDAVGSYNVTYNSTDGSGNTAVEVVRVVNVVDTTAPIITLTGPNPQTIELGAGYSELGATADDGSTVVIDASAFVDAIGSYSITYNATDAAGNNAVEVVRIVNVVDTTAPVISLTGANPQTIELGDGYSELGATADDGSTVVIDASAFVDALGSYNVTYNATDAAGNNAVEVVRVVNVVDTTVPVISLTGANPQVIERGNSYTELGATADDGSTVVIDAAAVNTNITGSYNVTYNATDAAGNNAVEVIRVVNVVDTTAPIITLTGANPQTIELGAGYSELGATTDDGSAVVIDASAFMNAVGSYNVTYNATDASGNNAVEVVRVVNVVDTTAPIITLTGANPQTIELGAGYSELGATADDGSTVVIDASAFMNAVGSYNVTYNATDAAGNNAVEVVRVVNVVDTTAPIITLTGANPQTIELGAGYSELGATTDDGSALVIDASAVNINVAGSYSVTYNATDASGNNASQVTRTVNVVDTTAPIITLTGANPQTIERGNAYSELGATTDDGSALVIDASAVNTNVVGSYSVTYNATDASGNNAAQVTRTVNVVDTTAPVITLTGANPQTIELGAGYSELGATTDDGSAVVIDATAFVDAIGSYSITYNATDASGNPAAEVIRTVNVVDTTAPVISLTGDNPQEIVEGTMYVELGATTDDGSAVVIDASAVNTNAVGSYSVTYDATDASGNNAVRVIRTVNIVPLLGVDDLELDQITLFPNPVSDRFVIAGISDSVDAVEIYAMDGRLVKTINNYASETIYADQLQEGVYLVRITAGTAVKTMQFIKKK